MMSRFQTYNNYIKIFFITLTHAAIEKRKFIDDIM